MGRTSKQVQVVRAIDRLNIGGPSYHVLLLSRSLNKKGYKTILLKGCLAPGEEELLDVVQQTGVRPHEVDGLGRAISPFQDVRALVGFYRMIRQVRPQVVHTHKSKAGLLGRLAAWIAGVPITVHTFHGHIFKGYFPLWKSRLIIFLERLLAYRTDAIVAVTCQQRQELLGYKIAPPSRLRSIPLGLQLEPYVFRRRADDGFRSELGFNSSAPLTGIITRLVPIKGVGQFLQAAQRVVSVIPEARFVVVGDGELRLELEDLAIQLGLKGKVSFTGYRRDTVRIYAALDLVVLSSFNEGLPVTLIEALAAGCYVVATHVGGVLDLVNTERLGLVVAPGDVGALAGAMIKALKELRCPPEEERKLIGIRYGIDRLTEDIDHLYRSIIKCKHLKQAGMVIPAAFREGTNG